jgi:hypothetical protein
MSNEERESLKILLTIHGEMSNQIKSASTSKNQFDSVFQLEQLTHEGSSVSSAGASLATTVMPKYLSVSPTGTEDTEMKASEKEKENEAVTVDGAGTLAARSGNEAIGDQGPSGHSRDDSG